MDEMRSRFIHSNDEKAEKRLVTNRESIEEHSIFANVRVFGEAFLYDLDLAQDKEDEAVAVRRLRQSLVDLAGHNSRLVSEMLAASIVSSKDLYKQVVRLPAFDEELVGEMRASIADQYAINEYRFDAHDKRKFLTGKKLGHVIKGSKLLAISFLNGDTDALPDELLEEIVKRHVSNFENFEKKNNEKFQKKVERFKDVLALVAEQYPDILGLSPEQVRDRLKTLKVEYCDASYAGLEELGGIYYPERHLIWIASNLNPQFESKTLLHELFHAVSGRAIRLARYEELFDDSEPDPGFVDEEWGMAEVSVPKSGLQIYKKLDDPVYSHGPVMFKWLNEAVTEDKAKQVYDKGVLTGMSDFGYKEYRRLFGVLKKAGLHVGLLNAAYEENYVPKEEANGVVPLGATRAFFRNTDEKFGKGFLYKVDFLVRSMRVPGNKFSGAAAVAAGLEEHIDDVGGYVARQYKLEVEKRKKRE